MVLEKRPRSQSRHAIEPGVCAFFPRRHAVQFHAPLLAVAEPGRQSWHTCRPEELAKEPAEQAGQDALLLTSENRP